jgi:hypothetical protein
MSHPLRPELGELPIRMQDLPLDERGYPIPAFVDTIEGKRDFRFMSQAHWVRCVQQKRCWVCGDRVGSYLAFVIGPMCTVNRTTSEPPCHAECARWSAQFCPFLSKPRMVRREDDLTDAAQENRAGCPILRNPGCCAVWITHSYRVWRDEAGKPLIEVGPPVAVEWWAEGRVATRAEVLASIESGMPLLEDLARRQEGAMEALIEKRQAVEALLPAG